MSAVGHSRRLEHVGDMSGLPQTADIFRTRSALRIWASADMTTLFAASLPVDNAVVRHVYQGCPTVHRLGQIGPASE